MDYSRAKTLHPNLKVGNVKRLIKAIRESDHLVLAKAKAEREPLKIGKRRAKCRDAEKIFSTGDIGKSGLPLVFSMENWMTAAPVDPDSSCINYDLDEPACGTAACIAGFAGALMPESKGFMVKEAIMSPIGEPWIEVLGEFLGIDYHTAYRMTSADTGDAGVYNYHVKPRHAVRLLENFLKTGKVDWMKAMGVKKRGRWNYSSTKIEAAALRREARELEAVAA